MISSQSALHDSSEEGLGLHVLACGTALEGR